MNVNTIRPLPIKENVWQEALKLWLDPKWKNKSLLKPEFLEFRHIDPNTMNQEPYFIAIDTETYESNGNMICLCNSENGKVLRGYPDKLPTITEIFFYLDSLVKKPNTYFVCYNLKFDASVLLKSMDKDTLEKFYYGIDDQRFQIKVDGIEVTYLHKKCLTMKKGKHFVKIYDALQFFLQAGENGSSKLDDVAKEYLGKQKQYSGKYQNKKFPDNLDKDLKELQMVITYCQVDCQLTKKLMDIWVNAFYNNFKFYPNAYYSVGYLASQYLKTKLDDFTCFRKVPFAVQDLAYASYFGGRFEIMERGRFKNIEHYDINSAYPYAMSKLPDFNNGKWIKITSLSEFKKYQDNVGFFKIHCIVKEKILAPFLFRNLHGQIIIPRGEFITQVTSMELKKGLDYFDVEIKRIVGYIFIPNSNKPTDFNKLILEMYDARMKQKNKGQKYVYKLLINALYGKFAQSKPEPKNLFNPVMCAAITGYCRAQLLDAVKDNKEDIIMLATDGIFSKKKLKLPTPKEKILGLYEHQSHPDMILIMAGIYSNNTKDDLTMDTKSRGFGLRVFEGKGKNKKELHFDLEDYKLTQKDGHYYYHLYNMRPIAISQAVIQKKYSNDMICKMDYVEKKIDINGDSKRLWLDYLKSIDDHNYSYTIRF